MARNISDLTMGVTVESREKNDITISIEEYTRLKDIETHFEILKGEMIHASYCPIHHQIILGIENEYKQATQELKEDLFPQNLQEGEEWENGER